MHQRGYNGYSSYDGGRNRTGGNQRVCQNLLPIFGWTGIQRATNGGAAILMMPGFYHGQMPILSEPLGFPRAEAARNGNRLFFDFLNGEALPSFARPTKMKSGQINRTQ